MRRHYRFAIGILAVLAFPFPTARAEILAMVNYESNAEQAVRREGIAIVDVDPDSTNFGKIIEDIPLPADLHNHHIFYNKDSSKAYLTGLSAGRLMVFDPRSRPFHLETIAVPDCEVGEDVVFSGDNSRWYLTCMGSSVVVVGDVAADAAVQTIHATKPYPHGIAIHDGIDRILITETVKHDLTEPGETITAIEASTGTVLSSYRVSDKPSPAGVAPVEVLFVPNSNPPVAYVTNMFGASLWAATWVPERKEFTVELAVDLAPLNGGVPLEMYFNKAGDRLYLTTANPGQFHIFDIGADPRRPSHLKAIPAAGGAHHAAFTKDGRYVFVQNNLLGLEGMNESSITVIDLNTEEVIASVETFKQQGLHPNLIVLLPEWNDPAGH